MLKFFNPLEWQVFENGKTYSIDNWPLFGPAIDKEYHPYIKGYPTTEAIRLKINDSYIKHSIVFKFPAIKNDKGYWQKVDKEFFIEQYWNKSIDNLEMKQGIQERINNAKYYVSKDWVSCDYYYDAQGRRWFIEDTDKEYKSYNPFDAIYSSVDYLNEDGSKGTDTGVVFINGQYEARVFIRTKASLGHTQLEKDLYGESVDECPKRWMADSYYFITLKNTKTGETKECNYFERKLINKEIGAQNNV